MGLGEVARASDPAQELRASYATLPSSLAVAEAFDGVEGAWLKVGLSFVGRAALVYGGLRAAGCAGDRKTAKNALAAAGVIEAFVLFHVWRQRQAALKAGA
jgi:hypothetical protein